MEELMESIAATEAKSQPVEEKPQIEEKPTPIVQNSPPPTPSLPVATKTVEKKARTEAQKAATERMRLKKMEKPKEVKPASNSSAIDTTLLFELERQRKLLKKDHKWTEKINSRFDSFEERLINLLAEPIDSFVAKSKTYKRPPPTEDNEEQNESSNKKARTSAPTSSVHKALHQTENKTTESKSKSGTDFRKFLF